MKLQNVTLLIALNIALLQSACSQNLDKKNKEPNKAMPEIFEVKKSDEEWKKILTPEQFHVIREKGTERPFTGKWLENKETGTYNCAACGNELFTSDMKFDSHCGWPSFDKEIAGGRIITKEDRTHGMVRLEIICGKCGGHLGHLFDDGPTETGMRYCVNSLSIDFKKDSTTSK